MILSTRKVSSYTRFINGTKEHNEKVNTRLVTAYIQNAFQVKPVCYAETISKVLQG